MEHKTATERGHRMLRDGGYSKGGEVTMPKVKAVVRHGIEEHEDAEHGGKRKPLRLKSGGRVKGGDVEGRPDRRARGGHLGKKGPGKVEVNILAGGHPDAPAMAPRPVGLPVPGGAPMPPQARPAMPMPMPPRPPMAAPPGAGPMNRGGGMRDRNGRFTGGAV